MYEINSVQNNETYEQLEVHACSWLDWTLVSSNEERRIPGPAVACLIYGVLAP